MPLKLCLWLSGLLAVAFPAVPCNAVAWNAVHAARFDLMTPDSKSTATELSSALCGFVEVLDRYLPNEHPLPLTVITFDDPWDFRRFCSVGGMTTKLDDDRCVIGVCLATSRVLVHDLVFGERHATTRPAFWQYLRSGDASPAVRNRETLLRLLALSEADLQAELA